MAAYWFTASTSFANPAVTIARAFTNTFAGIAPADVAAFIVAQMLGALGNIELPIAGGLYVLGGAGLLQLDSEAQSEAKVTFNVGAGARFNLGRIDGFLEARFGTASYTAGTFGYSKTSFIPITFGLTF